MAQTPIETIFHQAQVDLETQGMENASDRILQVAMFGKLHAGQKELQATLQKAIEMGPLFKGSAKKKAAITGLLVAAAGAIIEAVRRLVGGGTP